MVRTFLAAQFDFISDTIRRRKWHTEVRPARSVVLTQMTRPAKRRNIDEEVAAATSGAARDARLTFYYVGGETVDDPTTEILDLVDKPEVGEHKTYEVPPTVHQSSSTEIEY